MTTTVLMRHRLDEADAWFEHFVGDSRLLGAWQVMRSAENPDELVLMRSFDSRLDAEQFLAGSELREALQSSGVEQDSVRVEILDAFDLVKGGAGRSGRQS